MKTDEVPHLRHQCARRRHVYTQETDKSTSTMRKMQKRLKDKKHINFWILP